MEIYVSSPPPSGVWRVGRDPDPLAASKSGGSSEVLKPGTGNRFDSPSGNFGVRYFATSLDGCFGETLARFRPDPLLSKVIGDEWRKLGFMEVGDIPADWRQRRTAVRVGFPGGGHNAKFKGGVQFLDIESVETREAMRSDLAPLLAYYHYDDLDVALVRGRDRRVTRYISQWVFEQVDEDGHPLYAGIRYLSRLNTEWECWAVFDDVEIEELERRPLRGDDRSYKKIAKLYGLTPH
ncbi:MAG TPA: RES domain-containing protein [Solirubrobacterales bacterium]|nr:RES domain-containing protein [Solirubrobacterales bacterium]